MTRSVFYGFPAFVGSISGPTTCSFWTDDPAQIGWNSPQVTVDLSKNPEAARRGLISEADVQVDDHASLGTGGLTRIGPMFPGGTMIGAVYVEQKLMATKGLAEPGPRPYEWCTIQYYASEPAPLTNRRFYGFHAQIQSITGSIAVVSLWARGTSATPGQQPMGTWALDLAQYAHPTVATLAQISTAGQAGPLYLDARAGSGGVVQFDGPKTPRSLGGAFVKGGRHAR